MTDDSGALTVGSRMERIEDALGRIESKLDRKAELDDLRPLTHRIELLESGDTPLARMMLKQFEAQVESLNRIMEHGSPDAQEALRLAAANARDLETLKRSNLEKRASDKQAAATSEKHYKWLTFVVSLAVVILMTVTIIINVRGQATPVVKVSPPATAKP